MTGAIVFAQLSAPESSGREIRRGVDSKKLATLIISSLEGALMIARPERDREALVAARSYLESYLETEVRLTT